MSEVEHVHDRTGRGIEGATAETLTVQPVVLDESRDRGLGGEHVADIVLLGVKAEITMKGWRIPGPQRPATGRPSEPLGSGVTPAVPQLPAPFSASSSENEPCVVGAINAWSYQPSEVVIGQDHSGRIPVRLLLEEVDQGDEASLLIERIGVARVSVLVGFHLDEGYRQEVAGSDRRCEVVEVVGVVSRGRQSSCPARR